VRSFSSNGARGEEHSGTGSNNGKLIEKIRQKGKCYHKVMVYERTRGGRVKSFELEKVQRRYLCKDHKTSSMQEKLSKKKGP